MMADAEGIFSARFFAETTPLLTPILYKWAAQRLTDAGITLM